MSFPLPAARSSTGTRAPRPAARARRRDSRAGPARRRRPSARSRSRRPGGSRRVSGNRTRKRLVERALGAQRRAVEGQLPPVKGLAGGGVPERRYAPLAALDARQGDVRPEGPLFGLYKCPASSASDTAACNAAARPPSSSRSSANRRGSRGGSARTPVGVRSGAAAGGRAPKVDSAMRRRPPRPASRGTRASRAAPPLGPGEGPSPLDQVVTPPARLLPRSRREVECEEHARTRAAHRRPSSAPVRARRSRCIATVVERSRMSLGHRAAAPCG